MNYAALNAKIKGMSSREPSCCARELAASLCRYIPDKLQRDFVIDAAFAAAHGGSLHYYSAQWKRLNKLDKLNRVALRGALGAEIDLNNILWMYRLKRYHRVTGDATFGYLVPMRYKLSRETTRLMADAVTPKALMDAAANGPYAADFRHFAVKGHDMFQGGLTPDEMLGKAIARRYRSAARRYPNTLAPALAFIQDMKQPPALRATPF